MEPLELRLAPAVLAPAVLAPISDVSTGATSVQAEATFEWPYSPFSDSGSDSMNAEHPTDARVYLSAGLTGLEVGGGGTAVDNFDYSDYSGDFYAQIGSGVWGRDPGNVEVVTGGISGTAYANKSVKMTIEPDAGEMRGEQVTVYLDAWGYVASGGYASLLLKVGSLPAYSFIPVGVSSEHVFEGFTARIGDTVSLDVQTRASLNTIDGKFNVESRSYIDIWSIQVGSAQLPDLEAFDLGINVDAPAHPKVEYSYQVLETTYPDGHPQPEITEPFTIGFYWATSPDFEDRIGEPAHTITVSPGPDTEVGLPHSGSFDATALASQRPPTAKYVVMKVDSTDAIDEIDEDNNTAFVKAPEFPTKLTVTAQFDDEASKSGNGNDVFGLYLAGVNLKNIFTVSATGKSNLIKSIKYAFDADPTIDAVLAGSRKWAFSYNMGQLTAETNTLKTHKLNVAAFDASGRQVSSTYTGDVIASKKLDFELLAKAGASRANEEDVRFLSGVKANIAFTGKITGLPRFYQEQLKINVGDDKNKLKFDPNKNRTAIVHFTYNTSKLEAGPGGAPATTKVQAIVRYPVDVEFGDTPENLTAIGIPDWLKATTKEFHPKLGQYKLNDAALPVAKLTVPGLATGVEWLDAKLEGLETSASLAANVDVLAPLRLDRPPTVSVNRLAADAVMLGKSVWHRTYASSDVIIDARLDPRTLQPDGLKIALSHPVQLAQKTFLHRNFTVPILPSLSPAVTITVGLGLKLTGALDVNGAGLELRWENNRLEWVPEGTFIDVRASATGAATAKATAEVAGGWLGTYSASGTVKATLAINGRATLGGAVSDPQLVSTQLVGTLEGSYYYSLFGTPQSTGDALDENEEPAGTFGPVTLFEL